MRKIDLTKIRYVLSALGGLRVVFNDENKLYVITLPENRSEVLRMILETKETGSGILSVHNFDGPITIKIQESIVTVSGANGSQDPGKILVMTHSEFIFCCTIAIHEPVTYYTCWEQKLLWHGIDPRDDRLGEFAIYNPMSGELTTHAKQEDAFVR